MVRETEVPPPQRHLFAGNVGSLIEVVDSRRQPTAWVMVHAQDDTLRNVGKINRPRPFPLEMRGRLVRARPEDRRHNQGEHQSARMNQRNRRQNTLTQRICPREGTFMCALKRYELLRTIATESSKKHAA